MRNYLLRCCDMDIEHIIEKLLCSLLRLKKRGKYDIAYFVERCANKCYNCIKCLWNEIRNDSKIQKLWKVLINKDFGKMAGVSHSTINRLNNEEKTMTDVLEKYVEY